MDHVQAQKKLRINPKVYKIVGVFLMLVPFRLPIAVLLINFFNYIALLSPGNISQDILMGNVIITKVIYDLAIGVTLLYNVEMLSRDIREKHYRSSDEWFWWTWLVLIFMVAYTIIDGIQTATIFEGI